MDSSSYHPVPVAAGQVSVDSTDTDQTAGSDNHHPGIRTSFFLHLCGNFDFDVTYSRSEQIARELAWLESIWLAAWWAFWSTYLKHNGALLRLLARRLTDGWRAPWWNRPKRLWPPPDT